MIEDSILQNPLFDDIHEDEAGFYDSVEQRLAEIGVPYPEFVEFQKPAERRAIFWHADTKEYTAEGTDGLEYSWESLSNAYRELEAMGFDADFDESVFSSPEVSSNLKSDMIFMKPRREGDPSAELLIGPVNTRRIDFYGYYSFLRTAKAYLEEPSDFLRAYYFLNGHPAFWTRPNPEKFPFEWSTSTGNSLISMYPSSDQEGNVVISLEHGASYPPERKTRYHDTRLDTFAPTYEEAIVALAEKTHRYFHLDGAKREGIEYIPQAWEVEVAKRLDEYNQAKLAMNKEEN